MRKEYLKPALKVSETEIDLMKAYPWPESQMPATGGYAYPQVKEENVYEDEVEWGNIW